MLILASGVESAPSDASGDPCDSGICVIRGIWQGPQSPAERNPRPTARGGSESPPPGHGQADRRMRTRPSRIFPALHAGGDLFLPAQYRNSVSDLLFSEVQGWREE